MIRSAKILQQFLLGGFFTCVLAALAYAQALPPPENIEDRKVVRVMVSAKAQELAEEYAEILMELEDLAVDYGKNLMEFNSKSVAMQRKQLTRLAVKLAKGIYLDDIDLLVSDLNETTRELQEREKELKANDRKAYRVTRSLRRDLEAIKVVLQFEVGEQLQQEELLNREVAIYLQEFNFDLAEMMFELQIQLKDLGDTLAMIELDFEIPEVPEIPELAPLNEEHEVEEIPHSSETLIVYRPSKPAMPIESERLYTTSSGTTVAMREVTDSVEVISSSIPIYINSPTGQVKITGWDRKKILAQSQIEISSKSQQNVKDLVEQIQLTASPGDSGILVEVKTPDITDLSTTINKSQMEVMVPRNNRLVCSSAFGLITVTDIQSSVSINANNSSVTVSDISDAVSIINNMGNVTLTNIKGDIIVQSSFAPVTISDCSGNMEIKNSYAAIELSGCEGNVIIHNNGEIRLAHHEGSISINNSSGLVEIRDLVGDVAVTNSYNPVLLDGVEGSVRAENQRGIITALNIDGSLSIDNRYAPVTVRYLTGTLDIENHNGPIEVLVSEDISGSSMIHSSNSTIILTIEDDVALDLIASTINGEIKSSWPIDIITSGNTREAKFVLGGGGPSLTITGSNSNIIFNQLH
ncbi:MAG: hypothetical protein DRP47_04775 [Candidatus Zixiibacteriota bacterium]|nr:MAG: hypothetical protein DRP47_04775 [candidate division Zixibacteria bacterium]